MLQSVFVTADLFEATTPGENFINDRCFGEDFAEWLGERLLPSVSPVSEPIQEDWGWVLLVEFQGSICPVFSPTKAPSCLRAS